MSIVRRTTTVILVLAAFTWAAGVGTDVFATCANGSCREDRLHGLRGGDALAALGTRVASTAAAHGWSESKLRGELSGDPSLWLDPSTRLYYADVAAGDAATIASPVETLPVTPVADVFALHSRPGAPLVIYLDVDGNVTTGTPWNNSSGSTITSAPFSLDGDPTTFNTTERDRIQRWWLRVAEDFAPYEVDVTTQDPGVEALRKTSSTDTAYGTRVVISPTNWYSTSAGGVAYLNSFTWNTDTPAFVFTGQLGGGDEKYVAEAASHETGHTYGLSHDGTSTAGYYSGNNTWAPIMGVGYYAPLVQWSQGAYPDANNAENDLTKLAAVTPLRFDDAGNTPATAKSVPGDFTVTGLVSTATDQDAYTVTVPAGRLSATVRPAYGGDLDPSLTLLDANGAVIATANPPGATAASVSANVPAGTYTWLVDGVGMGDWATGYDDWASAGRYQLTGVIDAPSTVAATKSAPEPGPTVLAVSPFIGEAVTFDARNSYDPDGGPITKVAWAFAGTSPSTDSATTVTRTFTAAGRYNATLTVTDDEGVTASTTFTVVVRPTTTTTTSTAVATTTTSPATTTTLPPTTTTTVVPTTTTLPPTTTTVAPSTTTTVATKNVHVGGVRVRSGGAAGTVVADITLVADDGTAVAGVTVTGKWSGLLKGSATATSGSTGLATTPMAKFRKNGSITFTVTTVTTPAGYRWDGVVLAGSATF